VETQFHGATIFELFIRLKGNLEFQDNHSQILCFMYLFS
jgi:hypothetical protein